MDFNNNKPIYRQIADNCCNRILAGEWSPEERVPSVKELSIKLAVNNRTVLKAFEELSSMNVIYQKRGLGYFVTADAQEIIRRKQKADFMTTTLPDFINRMKLLGIKARDILPHLPE